MARVGMRGQPASTMRGKPASTAMLFALILGTLSLSAAFYLPGVAPTDYNKGDALRPKVEALTSVRTQLPYEYYVLPFCDQGVNMVNQDALNLGEVLRGSRIYELPYKFQMGVDENCKILCRKKYSQQEIEAFALMIEEDYRAHFLIDNLPVAMSVFHESEDGTTMKAYEVGYPLGHVTRAGSLEEDPDNPQGADAEAFAAGQIVLFNHLRFTILYHEDPSRHGMRIVGFEVEPYSVDHSYVNQIDFDECFNEIAGDNNNCALNTCSAKEKVSLSSPPLLLDPKKTKSTEVIWTYDVVFEPSPIKWSTRWDTYLQSADDAQVHWFSILNSFMIVVFLSGLIAMIMIRTLRKDFQRYEQTDYLEEGQPRDGTHAGASGAEAGWLAVLVGTGFQLTFSIMFLMIFACFGFLSPANRGALMQAMLFLFVFMGMIGGYCAARLFRTFKGNRWKSNSMWTAMLFPGFTFAIFFVLNLFVWGQKSSGAVPFGTLVALLLMWTGISAPLVFLGSYFGFRKAPLEFPTRTNQIPRQVPEQPWFVNGYLNILVGGILPFGAVFVEVFYVLSSIWLHQFYYLFGFLFLVVVILLLTCAEITVVMCYFQLCCEDYNWWWRSFFTSGCCSFYLFVYSLYYASSKLQMARAVAFMMYCGYMLIVSSAFFLITGSFGFLACLIFIRQIYAAIKID